MKKVAAVVLALGMIASLDRAASSQDKKEDKKEITADDKKVDLPNLDGKYTLVGGKKNNEAISDDAKKWEYSFTSDKMTIKSPEYTFVMGYKLDPKTAPMGIDLEILEGPEGTKGIKSTGIIEVKDDTVKIAYMMVMEKEKEKEKEKKEEKEKEKEKDKEKEKEKDKRPKNFEGKDGHMFEFKKNK